mmetsp:Transcript_35318/g.45005  ORF Transcript_35318/g.45005 Transcript_35318/m.45005 type:complete len:85 (-) Transcript_35318:1295-1549(-)
MFILFFSLVTILYQNHIRSMRGLCYVSYFTKTNEVENKRETVNYFDTITINGASANIAFFHFFNFPFENNVGSFSALICFVGLS